MVTFVSVYVYDDFGGRTEADAFIVIEILFV